MHCPSWLFILDLLMLDLIYMQNSSNAYISFCTSSKWFAKAQQLRATKAWCYNPNDNLSNDFFHFSVIKYSLYFINGWTNLSWWEWMSLINDSSVVEKIWISIIQMHAKYSPPIDSGNCNHTFTLYLELFNASQVLDKGTMWKALLESKKKYEC